MQTWIDTKRDRLWFTDESGASSFVDLNALRPKEAIRPTQEMVNAVVTDIVTQLFELNFESLRGKDGEDAPPITEDQVRAAAEAWLAENKEALTPPAPEPLSPDYSLIRAELEGMLEPIPSQIKQAVLESMPEPEKAEPLPNVVKSIERDARSHLIVTYLDGKKKDLGPMQTKNARGGSVAGASKQQILDLIRENVQMNPMEGYRASDEDSLALVRYYGYVKVNAQNWYIVKVDNTAVPVTYRYAAGATGYADNWTNRASLTYAPLQDVTIG